MEPKLTILGVYRPEIPQETWDEQWEVTADDDETKNHFAKLALIEGVVESPEGRMDFGKFGQMHLDAPDDPSRMMVGYDEALLSADGETLIERDMDCVQGTGPLRFAVYLHFYDPERPIQWEHGAVNAPSIEPAPARLMALVPYNACS